MATTTERLQRLRSWFIAYYLFESVVGIFVAAAVVGSLRFLIERYAPVRFLPGGIVAVSVLSTLAVLILALVLFHLLLQRRNWVRILMLVIAWLKAIGSVISLLPLLAAFSTSGWWSRMMPGVDWGFVIWIGAATNLAALAYSVYMIRTLQFDPQIRAEFPQGRALGGEQA